MSKYKEELGMFLRRHIFWFSIRLSALVLVYVLVEITYRTELLAVFGLAGIQTVVYDILQKIFFTLVAWFGFAIAKRIIVPAFTTMIAPATDKFIKEPASRARTIESIGRYLTYVCYVIVIFALLYIWAYSVMGVWISGFLGTGLIIALTFVLGLFTSSVLGNILAYSVLNTTVEFKKGDRVQIGEHYGDVMELSLFFTRIKTIKDEVISMPNLSVMGKEVKNFSALKVVLIYVPVSLGYDVDKDEAKRLLIESAEKTRGILTDADKKPFVLLRDLGNYTVTYEINAYTDRPNELVTIKSDLIDNILTEFKKSNIQILSPAHIEVKRHLENC